MLTNQFKLAEVNYKFMSKIKKAKLGSGKRFSTLSNKVAKNYQKKGVSAKKAKKIGNAVAAKAGIKKFGKTKMQKMAKAGKKVKA